MPGVVTQSEHHEECKHRGHDRESHDGQKIDCEHEGELRLLQGLHHVFPAAAAGRRNPRGMIGRDRFRQGEVEQDYVGQREAAGKKKRHVGAPAAQDSADGWTKNKAQSKGCANQSHSFGAIFLGRNVGNVGLGGRDVAARNSIDDAADEQHQQRRRKSEDQKTEAGSQQADNQNRTPAVSVREPAQHRREDELHHGIGSEQEPDFAGRRAKA